MRKLLSEFLCSNYEERLLSGEEKDTFGRFLNNLESSKKVNFIYRGTSHLNEQYNADISNIPLLSSYIFMIGEKGKMFADTHIKKYNTLKFIWDKFNQKICRLNFQNENVKRIVSNFLDKNPQFKEYFLNENNKDSFLDLNKVTETQKVVDYYLVLLHTIGKSGNGNSYFLSTTIDYSVAKNFSNDGIILYGWIPCKGSDQQIIHYEDVNKYNNFIESLNLPSCQTPMYPQQKEICLKCGLLPHFIIGFQYKEKFYINPNILKTPWSDNIVYNGININQTSFHEVIQHTRYKRTALFYDGNYYILQDNERIKI